jgi:hypothetical protein
MAFILRSHRDRYRQRAQENFYRGVALLACFAAAVTLGYVVGQKKTEQENRVMREKAIELQSAANKSENEISGLRAAYQTLRVQYEQLQSTYNSRVPQGEFGQLVGLVREQLDKGLPFDRLAQIIRAAQPPQNCTQPMNKRFIVSTSAYKGPQSVITFGDGAITLSGNGEPSINSKQEKEAWYDPGKPVEVVFTIIGGKKEVKKGLLPMHHTIILRDKEYRFTISEGPQSFVVVTGDSCVYPETAINKLKTSQWTSSSDSSM